MAHVGRPPPTDEETPHIRHATGGGVSQRRQDRRPCIEIARTLRVPVRTSTDFSVAGLLRDRRCYAGSPTGTEVVGMVAAVGF